VSPFLPLLLLAVWLLAWGEVSVANLASGIVLVAALLLAFPARLRSNRRSRLHPVAMLRLVLYVGRELVVSNALVTREILTPRSRIRTGVIGHRLEDGSDVALTLIANILALTPGTMTVDVTRDPPTLYVHFLLLSDVEEARRTIVRLERLVVAAIGERPPRARAADDQGGEP
jgi:multicomponent Na+:H+ antiporter subunit E